MTFWTSRVRGDGGALTRAPDLVRWGPVIAGVVIALALFALFDTLWLALVHTAGDGWVRGNLGWFIAVTGAVALFLAGLTAGMLAGVRGLLAGLANVFLLSLTTIIPGTLWVVSSLLATPGPAGGTTPGGAAGAPGGVPVAAALWTGFWSLVVGLVLAAMGGVLGGRIRRPVELPEVERRGSPSDAPAVAPPTNGTATPVDTEEARAHRGERR